MAAKELRTFKDLYEAIEEELKLQGDTTNRDRIKRRINMIYQDEVIPFKQWRWLRENVDVQIQPVYKSGTATVTVDSTTVTLSATVASSRKGYWFAVDGHEEVYRIAQHAAGSATVELEAPYSGASASGKNYKIWTNAIALPADVRETFEVSHSNGTVDGKGYQTFQKVRRQSPKHESKPSIYTLGDHVDPAPYDSISGLPALSTRASSGLVKTLVFASDVSALISVGDRIEVSDAGHYTYNGEVVVSSVSTATITYTGKVIYDESATADSSLTVKSLGNETNVERYRELLIHPAIVNTRATLNVDYIKEAPPLNADADEPLMPLEDRIVLYYGALSLAWPGIKRDPDEAVRNERRYKETLQRMTGEVGDSRDLPVMRADPLYSRAKRRLKRRSVVDSNLLPTGGSGTTTSTPTGTANRAAIFGNDNTLAASDVTTTELNYLDGLTSAAVGISDTQTLTNKTIDGDNNTISNLAHGAEVDNPSSGVHGVTGSVVGTTDTQTLTNKSIDSDNNTITNIVDADIKSTAAITRTKIANGTADHVLINSGAGVFSSEAQLAITRGGTGAATATAGFDALSPTTTKGDVIASDGTNNVRKAVGGDGQILSSNSAQSDGLEWIDPPEGGRNYIPAGDSRNGENGVGSWVAFDDVSALTDGTGGSPNVSVAKNTSTPLIDSAHLRLATTAADNQYEGWSCALDTVEEADKGKVHTISFLYRTDANYVDDDIEVWVYDITNTTLIQPTPYLLKKESLSAGAELFQAHVQLPIDSDSYRLILHQNGTNANAVNVDIDDVKFQPVSRTYGTPVTDWISFTPTGSWSTNTTYTGYKRRVGDTEEYFVKIALAGAPNSATLTVNIPNNSIDTAKIPDTDVGQTQLGTLIVKDSAQTLQGRISYNSSTSVICQFLNSSSQLNAITEVAPITFTSTDELHLLFKVPIAGWSSSTVMSSDADTRVVAMKARLSASDTGVADKVIAFDTVDHDTHNGLNTSTGVYTIPVAGTYRIKGVAYISSSGSPNNDRVAIRKNSTAVQDCYMNALTGSAGYSWGMAYDEIECNAGDTIDIYVDGDASFDIEGANTITSFTVSRISGPAQIAASEKVSATYEISASTANSSFADNSAEVVDYDVKKHDSHNAVTTGASWVFTAPRKDKSLIYASLLWANTTNMASQELRIHINGTLQHAAGIDVKRHEQLSVVLDLSSGDTVDVRGFQDDSASAARSVTTTGEYSYISISSLGGV